MLRMIKRSLWLAVLLTLGWPSMATPPIDPVFIGRYDGSGRACYGILRLTPKSFSWSTPFTSIRKAPYEILDQSVDAAGQKLTVLLKKKSKGWFYVVVSLEHTVEAPERFWSVVGYRSLEDYKNNNQPDSLGCLMIK